MIRTSFSPWCVRLSVLLGITAWTAIADGAVAMRRGEDVPRPRGGTRYQEMCRTALQRLILRGLVRRVEPGSKKDLMRFERTAISSTRAARHDA